MQIGSWLGGALCGIFTATTLYAGAVSLLEIGSKSRGGLSDMQRGALYSTVPNAPMVMTATLAPASLFAGREKGSLFAMVEREGRSTPLSGRAVTLVRDIIQQAESSRAGYDAVQHGAKIKPPQLPTKMTVAEIYRWIEATPGQPHAIGRYQFIPVTLRRVVREANVSLDQRFTPALQDRLADVLLAEAGYHEVKNGALSRRAFMNNLAKIWAGLPNDTGKSHYHGYAGNKASISWARFDAQMAQVFPK
ncbi:hypothetical protein GGR95_000021 [Sulfitobacter undariae]|uniref:Muramidase (Phage lysozyme) n=1 Tax=Sulfitobacter undariae TaxID=1563671 RepID=A0A7W6GYV3_9RHOB|nr:hypothetical protein [Sulfitobacter undariae]MBB3992402.1 hypothetical protein [Sulfitobacter undariae]